MDLFCDGAVDEFATSSIAILNILDWDVIEGSKVDDLVWVGRVVWWVEEVRGGCHGRLGLEPGGIGSLALGGRCGWGWWWFSVEEKAKRLL